MTTPNEYALSLVRATVADHPPVRQARAAAAVYAIKIADTLRNRATIKPGEAYGEAMRMNDLELQGLRAAYAEQLALLASYIP